MILQKTHKFVNKSAWFYQYDKFANKKWEGVKSEKIKVFPMVWSKYLQ